MQKTDFSSKVTSTGFMLYYKGKPIGGEGTQGTATHTSDGRPRSWQARKADVEMFNESVARDIDNLVAGRGQARYLKVIEEIDGAVQAV